ncbi:MAG TPA: VOC family protein [Longimicrobium sp.]|nr:VOC family protein [Longimicrobium sp.]
MATDTQSRIRAAAGAADAAPKPAQAGEYGIAPEGFRLPVETRIGRVVLQVANLERSLRYYGEVIGFRVLEREGGRAVLGAHGDNAPLLELREKPGVRPVPRRGLLGLYHFAILLPDRAALGRFLAHLRQIGAYAGMSDHFVSEAIYLTDPDGLGIEVYADRPRSAWVQRGLELAMATEPLDAADVIRSAGGQPWTGAPAGTAIGHVHHYVGDIEQAARFYHTGLGFDLVVWSYPGALFVSAGGYHHHVGMNTWASGAAAATDNDARLLHWELLLPDASSADAVAESLRAAGFAPEQADGGWIARDPWGIAVRIAPDPAA